jgi:class 3 adenylate cyclase/predicted ATPase
MPARFRYCGACGALCRGSTSPSGGSPQASGAEPAERRQLTVLFADLVGSTALAQQLDPEDLRDLMRLYATLSAEVVGRFGGTLAEVAGDGTIVYFGHPKAFEDAAERAVHAGLALVEGLRGLALPVPVEVRIGIASGLMIVGDLIETAGIRQREIVGSPANLAARLQKLAPPNGVVIGAATKRLVGGAFDLLPLGAQQVEGFAAPIEAFAVRAPQVAASRFEAHAGNRPGPLVGRTAESALIEERWRQVLAGNGGCVLIRGEPGIGKSRLVRELEDRVTREAHGKVSFAGSPLHCHTPFFPVLGELQLDEPARSRDLAPDRRREALIEAALGQLLERATRQPLLVVFEDAQWLDATTLELVGRLIREVKTAPVLLVVTFRRSFVPPWDGLDEATTITLGPLGRKASRQLVDQVRGSRQLVEAVVAAIIERTDGIPLFIEETTQAMLEAGHEAAAASAVPETLRDTLMARLDRHESGRAVAQIAAAIGRSFSYELLALVAPMPPAALHAALDSLIQSDLIFQDGLPPRATYVFKHALIQEIAYESQLKRRRRSIHAQIAATLRRHFPATPAGVLGHHHAEAGEVEAALDAFERAAGDAISRSASVEAAAHLARALQLLSTLAAGPERDRRELELVIAHGAQLASVSGNAADEAGRAYERAIALSHEVGEPRHVFRALRGLQTFHIVRGTLTEAKAIGERLLTEAGRSDDDELLLQAHRPHGLCLLYMGELEAARHHSTIAVSLYDPDRHARHRFVYNSDPGVLAHCSLAWAEWLLGDPAAARRASAQALALAEAPEPHPHSRAFALSFQASLEQFEGREAAALEQAEELLALAARHRFAYWLAWGRAIHGWALARGGRSGDGLEECRMGLASYRATGAGLMVPYFSGLLAEACHSAGRLELGLEVVDQALADAEAGGIRFYLPFLHQLQAELFEASGAGDKAVAAALRQALGEAEAQGSRRLAERVQAKLDARTGSPAVAPRQLARAPG